MTVAVLLAVLALVGCGQQPQAVGAGPGSGHAGDPRPDAAPACTATLDPGAPGPAVSALLPAGVAVVAVRRCTREREVVPGDGEWQVSREERATGPDLAALVAALRLPSELPAGGACTADMRLPVEVDVETADGAVVRVGTPKDGCGQTRNEVLAAYRQLVWTAVSQIRGEQTRSDAAVAGGCDAWKDMLALSASGGSAGRGSAAAALPPGRRLHVCVYRSAYPPGWSAGDQTVVDGVPLGGGHPSDAVASKIADYLNHLDPAQPCRQQHSRFAVVTVDDQQQPYVEPIYVELDGCYRVLIGDGSLRQGLAPATAALLDLPAADAP